MKRLFLLFCYLAVLAFNGTAFAGEYIVQKGDCLSKIGSRLGINWRTLAVVNKISNYNCIYPGQKLIVQENDNKKKNSPRKKAVDTFYYRYPGGEKYTGSLDTALRLLDYPEDVRDVFRKKIQNNIFEWGNIRNDDKFLMVFGKSRVRHTIAAWEDPQRLLAARVYTAEKGGKKYILKKVLLCGNWCRPAEEISIPAAPVVSDISSPSSSLKGISEIPTATIPKLKTELGVEHEPIVGAYIWGNNLAEGHGYYGEYMTWLRKKYVCQMADGWSPGVGIYGMYSEGNSKLSSYSWDEKGIGPQIGLKYISSRGKPWQWQGKLRLAWEEMNGSNKLGYSMSQNNVKLGFYTEYTRAESERWIWGVTGETWFALDRHINSTWSGDKPSNRMTLGANAFVQRKINNDWQVRGAFGIFYQGWDDLTGLRAQLEARYKEALMFGPWVSFFPFGITSAYNGYSASDLTTIGGFVRLELGGIFREWDRKSRMRRIKKVDNEVIKRIKKGGIYNDNETDIVDCFYYF